MADGYCNKIAIPKKTDRYSKQVAYPLLMRLTVTVRQTTVNDWEDRYSHRVELAGRDGGNGKD